MEDAITHELYGDKPESSIIRRFHAKVVGVKFENDDGSSRQDIIKSLKEGQKVRLIWNRHNKYDENAIICAAGVNGNHLEQPDYKISHQFGHLKSDLSGDIIGMATDKSLGIYAEVAKVLTPHTSDSCYGVVILIYIYELFPNPGRRTNRKSTQADIVPLITKKYAPKKSITCPISLAVDHKLKPGSKIFLKDEDVEYYSKFDDKFRLRLDFLDDRGDVVACLQCYVAAKEKILRARFSGYGIDIEILSIKEQSEYLTEIIRYIGAKARISFIKASG